MWELLTGHTSIGMEVICTGFIQKHQLGQGRERTSVILATLLVGLLGRRTPTTLEKLKRLWPQTKMLGNIRSFQQAMRKSLPLITRAVCYSIVDVTLKLNLVLPMYQGGSFYCTGTDGCSISLNRFLSVSCWSADCCKSERRFTSAWISSRCPPCPECRNAMMR